MAGLTPVNETRSLVRDKNLSVDKRYATVATDDIEQNDEFKEYIHDFENKAEQLLQSELDSITEAKRQWDLNGSGLGIDGTTARDWLHHCFIMHHLNATQPKDIGYLMWVGEHCRCSMWYYCRRKFSWS